MLTGTCKSWQIKVGFVKHGETNSCLHRTKIVGTRLAREKGSLISRVIPTVGIFILNLTFTVAALNSSSGYRVFLFCIHCAMRLVTPRSVYNGRVPFLKKIQCFTCYHSEKESFLFFLHSYPFNFYSLLERHDMEDCYCNNCPVFQNPLHTKGTHIEVS